MRRMVNLRDPMSDKNALIKFTIKSHDGHKNIAAFQARNLEEQQATFDLKQIL